MHRSRQKMKKILCSCFLTVCFLMSSVNGLAAETGSIQISYHSRTDEGTVILSGASFVLYRAGFWNGWEWELSEEFHGSGVSMKNSDASERKKQAELLYAYAAAEQMQGVEQKTDESGNTKFEHLEGGLYLIAQTQDLRKGNWTFRSSPFLVSLPGKESGTDIWDITAEPKSEQTESGSGGGSGGGSHGGGHPGSSVDPEGSPPASQAEERPEAAQEESLSELLTYEGRVEKAGTPQTGDFSLLEFWILLLAVSGAVAGIILWKIWKQRPGDESEGRD